MVKARKWHYGIVNYLFLSIQKTQQTARRIGLFAALLIENIGSLVKPRLKGVTQ
jgi:hypothetical protein